MEPVSASRGSRCSSTAEGPRDAEGRLRRRDLLRHAALIGGAAVLGPAVLAACPPRGDDTLARAQRLGYVRLGMADEEPYGYRDEQGRAAGQAPDVASEVLDRLDIPETVGLFTSFESLIPGLLEGEFDIIAAGMFITPQRCEEVLFSDPDYCAPLALAVAEGNPLDLSDLSSVAEHHEARLGVLSGAVEHGYARRAGVRDAQIVTYGTEEILLAALLEGAIDAFALTSITVRRLVEGQPLDKTDPFVPVVDDEPRLGCGAYAFRPEDRRLRDEFNDVLVSMRQDGEILPLVEDHGFTQAEIRPARGRSADDHC